MQNDTNIGKRSFGVFRSRGIGGYKMPKKSWDSNEIDERSQDIKIVIVLISLFVIMILMAFFFRYLKTHFL